ncbi:hypothetical protein BGW42_007197, partial [Actinomortierella wolfii]
MEDITITSLTNTRTTGTGVTKAIIVCPTSKDLKKEIEIILELATISETQQDSAYRDVQQAFDRLSNVNENNCLATVTVAKEILRKALDDLAKSKETHERLVSLLKNLNDLYSSVVAGYESQIADLLAQLRAAVTENQACQSTLRGGKDGKDGSKALAQCTVALKDTQDKLVRIQESLATCNGKVDKCHSELLATQASYEKCLATNGNQCTNELATCKDSLAKEIANGKSCKDSLAKEIKAGNICKDNLAKEIKAGNTCKTNLAKELTTSKTCEDNLAKEITAGNTCKDSLAKEIAAGNACKDNLAQCIIARNKCQHDLASIDPNNCTDISATCLACKENLLQRTKDLQQCENRCQASEGELAEKLKDCETDRDTCSKDLIDSKEREEECRRILESSGNECQNKLADTTTSLLKCKDELAHEIAEDATCRASLDLCNADKTN